MMKKALLELLFVWIKVTEFDLENRNANLPKQQGKASSRCANTHHFTEKQRQLSHITNTVTNRLNYFVHPCLSSCR